MFQGIFKSEINDANKNYIFGTGSIPIQIKTAQLATFADGTTKQQGYQVAEVNKLISTMLTGWDANGNKPKSMSDNYLELILSCDNGFVVKKRLQFPHIIAWQNDSTPYNIADVYKEFSIDNWLKADDFENPDITLVVEPTDEILTTSTATPPEVTTTNSGRFYLYYRNLPVGVNRIHIDFHIKTKTEPIDFDLEVVDGLSWKDAQAILASNEQAKINVLLNGVKDIYKYTGAEGNFEDITMYKWSALYKQIISLAPSNKFTHDLYFYIYDESELNTKITELEKKTELIEIDGANISKSNIELADDDGNVAASIYVPVAGEDIEDSISFMDDKEEDVYVKIGKDGIHAKNVYIGDKPITRRANNMFYQYYKVQVVGHKGRPIVCPDNTFASFKKAMADGLKFVEADVQLTSDHIPVIFHDDNLNGDEGTQIIGNKHIGDGGTIASHTLSELKSYDFGSWFSPDFTGEKIPTLEELLILCKKYNTMVELDLTKLNIFSTKQSLQYVVDVVKKLSMQSKVVFTAWPNTLRSLSNLITDVAVSISATYSTTDMDNASDIVNIFNVADFSIQNINVTQELVNYAHSKGCQVKSWTENNATNLSNLFNMGVDRILTDTLSLEDKPSI